MEEFIFIFDFKETTTTGTYLANSMLFELRNKEDRNLIPVLGIRQNLMFYSTYDNAVIHLGLEKEDNEDFYFPRTFFVEKLSEPEDKDIYINNYVY